MTVENQNILEDFYTGNHKFIAISVLNKDGSPKDLSNSEIVYTLYRDNGEVVVYKDKVSGQITVSGASSNIANVAILPPDTLYPTLLTGLFRHELVVVDETGKQETVTRGKVQIFRSYAARLASSYLTAYAEGG